MVESRPATLEMEEEVFAGGIRLLSLMVLLRPNPEDYNCVQLLSEKATSMTSSRRHAWARLATACLPIGLVVPVLVFGYPVLAAGQKDSDKDKDTRRPRVTLKAQPMVAMSPARIVLTAELVGGSNDFEEFYCPTIQWDWGDGTQSESTSDCEPFEPGKTELKRRFTVEHVFRAGAYRVMFRMKRREKAVGAASVSIQVRPGLRESGEER